MAFALSHFDHPSKGKSIGDLHGEALKALAPFGPVTIFPLYHPAAVFYNRKLEPALDSDFSRLIELAREI
jgi:uracil-DNA glycosylase